MSFGIVAEPASMSATESLCYYWNSSCLSCRDSSCDWSSARDYHFRRPVHPPSDDDDDGGGASDVCCCYVGPCSLAERPPTLSEQSVDNLYR